MRLSDLTDTTADALKSAGALLADLMTPTVRLGVTGLALWRIQAARKRRTGQVHDKRVNHITSHKPVMPNTDANAV